MACATLAGNSLGAGNGLRAKRFAHLAYVTCLAVGLVQVSSTFLYRGYDSRFLFETLDLRFFGSQRLRV